MTHVSSATILFYAFDSTLPINGREIRGMIQSKLAVVRTDGPPSRLEAAHDHDPANDSSSTDAADLGRLPWLCVAGSAMFLVCTFGESIIGGFTHLACV